MTQLVNWVVDTVLLDKLMREAVVGGNQCWMIDASLSRMEGGIAILGPLLFLIYTDYITKVNLSAGSRLVLYADDILLYHPSLLLKTIVFYNLMLMH